MNIAEDQWFLKCGQLERLFDLAVEKCQTIQDANNEVRAHNTISGIQDKANNQTSILKSDKRKLKVRCQEDLEKLESTAQRIEWAFQDLSKSVALYGKNDDSWMVENYNRQEALWARIQDLEKDFQKVCQERVDEVDRRLRAKETFDLQQREYSKFTNLISTHKVCFTYVHLLFCL